MSEQWAGESIEAWAALFDLQKFQRDMRATGITSAQAVERLREAAQHFDPDAFDLLIATHRPQLWKRMNKRPSLARRILQRVAH